MWYGDIDGGSHSHARYNAARCDGASGVQRPRQSQLLFPVQQHHGVELQARHLHTPSHPSTQHSPQKTEHTQTRSEMSQNGGQRQVRSTHRGDASHGTEAEQDRKCGQHTQTLRCELIPASPKKTHTDTISAHCNVTGGTDKHAYIHNHATSPGFKGSCTQPWMLRHARRGGWVKNGVNTCTVY